MYSFLGVFLFLAAHIYRHLVSVEYSRLESHFSSKTSGLGYLLGVFVDTFNFRSRNILYSIEWEFWHETSADGTDSFCIDNEEWMRHSLGSLLLAPHLLICNCNYDLVQIDGIDDNKRVTRTKRNDNIENYLGQWPCPFQRTAGIFVVQSSHVPCLASFYNKVTVRPFPGVWRDQVVKPVQHVEAFRVPVLVLSEETNGTSAICFTTGNFSGVLVRPLDISRIHTSRWNIATREFNETVIEIYTYNALSLYVVAREANVWPTQPSYITPFMHKLVPKCSCLQTAGFVTKAVAILFFNKE